MSDIHWDVLDEIKKIVPKLGYSIKIQTGGEFDELDWRNDGYALTAMLHKESENIIIEPFLNLDMDSTNAVDGTAYGSFQVHIYIEISSDDDYEYVTKIENVLNSLGIEYKYVSQKNSDEEVVSTTQLNYDGEWHGGEATIVADMTPTLSDFIEFEFSVYDPVNVAMEALVNALKKVDKVFNVLVKA